jgi:outer membrane protein assembly factor BamE (lipoprotein component of BamABCDE complex)
MRKVILALIMVAVMGVAGCSQHFGPKIDYSKLDQLVIGKTTKSQVVALFGAMPSSQSKNGKTGQSTLTWVHTRMDVNPALVYVPGATDTLTAVFDKDDVLQDFTYAGNQSWRTTQEGGMEGGSKPDLGVKQ